MAIHRESQNYDGGHGTRMGFALRASFDRRNESRSYPLATSVQLTPILTLR